jgi:GNAT superfamily N-acetyltransferase
VTRSLVTIRPAAPGDAPRLTELWSDILRGADPAEQLADMISIIESVAALKDECLVVAEYDGGVGGAVYLRAATLTPLNLEPMVQAVSPHVFPEFRRRGIGRALMEAAAAFAEERGIAHVATASLSVSRDANRFMARLGLGPQAVLRVGTTQTLRARLTAQRPALRPSGRQIGQVLAARRTLRKRQGATATES